MSFHFVVLSDVLASRGFSFSAKKLHRRNIFSSFWRHFPVMWTRCVCFGNNIVTETR
jgi:hypothetical protein